jgi:phosphatidate cytidylyltransferase
MNKAGDMAGRPHHAPNYRGIRWHWDCVKRPLFGLVLGAIVIAVLFKGPFYFMLWVAVVGAMAAREWHRMVGGAHYRSQAFFTGSVVAFACFAMVFLHPAFVAFEVLGIGALAAYFLAKLRGQEPYWRAGGILYLGIPCVCLVALRVVLHDTPQQAAWAIAGLFVIVWMTDIGALIFGNLIGGPRLAPVLSPNKTWAGAIGGVVAATLTFAFYIRYLGGNVFFAAPAAVFLSVTAHGGDLFESWVKRRFKVKNSGSMIPGHGGVLDRVDSLLSAGVMLAILVFAFGVDPLFGAHGLVPGGRL